MTQEVRTVTQALALTTADIQYLYDEWNKHFDYATTVDAMAAAIDAMEKADPEGYKKANLAVRSSYLWREAWLKGYLQAMQDIYAAQQLELESMK